MPRFDLYSAPHPHARDGEKFVFRKQAILDLWKEELTGQLSDGMWENSWKGRHFNDYSYWGSLPVEVGTATKVVTDRPRWYKCFVSYNSKFLLDCVGDRMLSIVQKTEPDATMKTVRAYNNEIAAAIRLVKC
jgi:hypothetical protein